MYDSLLVRSAKSHARTQVMAAFNARKSAQVISYFISKTGTRHINILKAVKLVYLADRRSIQKFGYPILDEQRVSMPRGPVNSMTYGHACGEYDLDACGWSEYLEDRAHHEIGARKAFSSEELDELSDADIECMDETWAEFGHMNQWQLVDWTHDRKNIPEWEDPNGSSAPIPLERILTFVGVDNADEHAAVAAEQERIERVLNQLRG
jgi:uncharacterized phage-associated protein